MKCYNHNHVDALGICKTCNKGICKDCLTDVGNGIACTATCIDEVNELNGLVERNKTIYKKASKNNISRGYIYTLTGLAFLIIDWQMDSDDKFLFIIGLMMFILGGYSIYIGYTQKNK